MRGKKEKKENLKVNPHGAKGKTYVFFITDEHAGHRVDSVLSFLLKDFSRGAVQNFISDGNVFLNGKPLLQKSYRVKAGQILNVNVPLPEDFELLPEDIPLDILYEDEFLIVVNKPKGMVVHPGAGNMKGTLSSALLFHCGKLSFLGGEDRPGIVHRIDKDTSGLIVAAKDDETHEALSKSFAERNVKKIYTAVAFHNFKEESGTVNSPIARDTKNRLKMAVLPTGRPAVTHWKVSERFKGFDLLDVQLETGRTHQIRVHLASLGHPLLGDKLYGSSRQPFGIESQMLHAKVLGFVHPKTMEYLEFYKEPPEGFLKVVDRLRRL